MLLITLSGPGCTACVLVIPYVDDLENEELPLNLCDVVE